MSHAARSAHSIAVAVGLVLVVSSAGRAQVAAPATTDTAKNGWEMLFSSGALVPTGVERKSIKDAQLSTGQLSYVVASRFAVTTTVGWARSRDLIAENTPRLSVFSYDVGLEARAPRWAANDALAFTPFSGVGVGGRSFDHRGGDLATTHAPTGYASLGGELAVGRARVRLEARDYLTHMTPLIGGGPRELRNDVTIIAGFRIALSSVMP